MIKAMRPDSRNDLLTVSGVSYYTHANTHTFICTDLHMHAHTQVIALINTGEKTCTEMSLHKLSCISATLVSVHSVASRIPHHVWAVEINLSGGCCEGPVGVKYPKLAQHVSRVSSDLFSVSVVSPSTTALLCT